MCLGLLNFLAIIFDNYMHMRLKRDALLKPKKYGDRSSSTE